MARNVGAVEIDIRGDSGHFRRELQQSEAISKQTNAVIRGEFAKTEAASAGLTKSIRGVGASLIALSAAGALGIGASIGILKDFGAAMSTVEAVTGANEVQMAALTAEARRLGATTKFSATQAAEGMIYLARAGFTANEAMMSIEGTLKLAQAGNLDLGRAADIASNVLGGFNLTAAETPRIVDVLAKAANSANVTVESLGESLKFAAPTANALGLELEETVAIIGKLGDSGLQGGLGGRGFQSFATSFVSKKDEITALIGDFNVAEDGMIKLIKRLVEAGITTEQVIDIFRAENVDVFTILANASQDAAKGLDPLLKKLVDARGTADTVAKVMGENLNGAILTAQSAMQELILTFGQMGVTDALVAAFSGLTSLFRLAAENADIVAVALTAMAARAIIPLIAQTVPAAIGALGSLGASLLGVSSAAGVAGAKMSLLGGPLTLVIAAAAAAYIALARSVVTIDEAVQSFGANLTKLQQVQKDIKGDTEKLEAANRRLEEAIKDSGEASVTAAALEVDAIRKRIAANKELEKVYKGRLQTDLDNAKIAEKRLGNDVRQGLGLERRFDFNTNKEVQFETEALINLFEQEIAAVRNSDRTLSDHQVKIAETVQAYREASQAVSTLSERLNEINNPVVIEDPVKTLPGTSGTGGGTGLSDEQKSELAAQLRALTLAERAYALDLARAQANQDVIDAIEEIEAIEARMVGYMEAGISATDARARAEAEVLAIKLAQEQSDQRANDLQQRLDTFRLNKAEADAKKKEIDDAIEKSRDKFRETFSGAVEEALASGNVGQAIKNVFADRIAEGMKEALNEVADAIYELFSQVFKSSGGSSGGGGFGGFLSAAGSFLFDSFGKAFGGSPASASALSGSVHSGGNNLSPTLGQTIINIAGDASEKTIAIMDQKLAEHRAALPSAIDSRVSESIKRGRY